MESNRKCLQQVTTGQLSHRLSYKRSQNDFLAVCFGSQLGGTAHYFVTHRAGPAIVRERWDLSRDLGAGIQLARGEEKTMVDG